jgi:hypothetical protein
MNGHDVIYDFQSGKDKIDLTANAVFDIHHFSDLNIEILGFDSIIHFDADNDVTVVGNIHLAANDFMLA